MLGPRGSNENQVAEAFFHLISDEATGNHMTSLKTMIEHQYSPLFFLRNWLKHLYPDSTQTDEELNVLLCEDHKLFIEMSVLCTCVFLPLNTLDRTAE